MCSEGLESSGKTGFALTAPGATLYQDFDLGLEGVAGSERVLRGLDGSAHKVYNLSGLGAVGQTPDQVKAAGRRIITQFVKDFMDGLGKYRTIVSDTFTAAWAGQRLSDERYVLLEEEFRSMLRAAYLCETTNVILIHHLRQDWAKTADGKSYKGKTWSRDGMDGVANAVQLAIRHRYTAPIRQGELLTPGKFEIDILKCRDNIGLVGQTFPGMDFATLMGMIAPTVDWSK